MRNATGLVWGNIVASGFQDFLQVFTDRSCGSAGSGCSSSNGGGDQPTPNGWGYCGTGPTGLGSNWDGNTNTTTGYPCLDGIGRGQTLQSLNGRQFPNKQNTSTGTIAWPQQYLEPWYTWNNQFTGAYAGPCNYNSCGSFFANYTPAVITTNQDIYLDNASFNGTSGTGWGTVANRPSTCTPGSGGTYFASPTGSYGVGYFATDANGGQGELYVCTSANTWTAVYEPYTFPHPLAVGDPLASSSSLAAPTNLTATVQ
jgi:hypothetical protein